MPKVYLSPGEFTRTGAPPLPHELGDPGLPSQRQNLIPRFYIEAERIEANPDDPTTKPSWRDTEYVEILIAGNTKLAVVKRVNDDVRATFPREYAAFTQNKVASRTGTPLEEWPGISASQVKMLKHANVGTVEDLVAMPDAFLQELGMGMRALQVKAQAYLARMTDNASTERLAEENQHLREENARLDAQMKEMAAKVDILVQKFASADAPPPKPGKAAA